ncbi:hypothetical protein WOLCODRAFT_20484 [Wolfiporia cocos MD-104 SS10]|uniref:RNI-like protein n=1 Tax=Wolfiporia cocos (strain MD-104) TaxID=742152 RepID=A0A2H3J969_WOLCO|nr:hypothetical protein WOLCODRAFT_20484 [Wolfiporia cocos MD-104 SS10]
MRFEFSGSVEQAEQPTRLTLTLDISGPQPQEDRGGRDPVVQTETEGIRLHETRTGPRLLAEPRRSRAPMEDLTVVRTTRGHRQSRRESTTLSARDDRTLAKERRDSSSSTEERHRRGRRRHRSRTRGDGRPRRESTILSETRDHRTLAEESMALSRDRSSRRDSSSSSEAHSDRDFKAATVGKIKCDQYATFNLEFSQRNISVTDARSSDDESSISSTTSERSQSRTSSAFMADATQVRERNIQRAKTIIMADATPGTDTQILGPNATVIMTDAFSLIHVEQPSTRSVIMHEAGRPENAHFAQALTTIEAGSSRRLQSGPIRRKPKSLQVVPQRGPYDTEWNVLKLHSSDECKAFVARMCRPNAADYEAKHVTRVIIQNTPFELFSDLRGLSAGLEQLEHVETLEIRFWTDAEFSPQLRDSLSTMLARITTLVLYRVQFQSQAQLLHLLRSCSNLIDLDIDIADCAVAGLDSVAVFSPYSAFSSLKRLKLNDAAGVAACLLQPWFNLSGLEHLTLQGVNQFYREHHDLLQSVGASLKQCVVELSHAASSCEIGNMGIDKLCTPMLSDLEVGPIQVKGETIDCSWIVTVLSRAYITAACLQKVTFCFRVANDVGELSSLPCNVIDDMLRQMVERFPALTIKLISIFNQRSLDSTTVAEKLSNYFGLLTSPDGSRIIETRTQRNNDLTCTLTLESKLQ